MIRWFPDRTNSGMIALREVRKAPGIGNS